MIRLTRINQAPFVLNAELIEYVDTTPDTVITLSNNQKLIVLESAEEVVQRVIEYRRAIAHPPLVLMQPPRIMPPIGEEEHG